MDQFKRSPHNVEVVKAPLATNEQNGLVNQEAEYLKKRFRWGMVWEFIRTIPHYMRWLLEL